MYLSTFKLHIPIAFIYEYIHVNRKIIPRMRLNPKPGKNNGMHLQYKFLFIYNK